MKSAIPVYVSERIRRGSIFYGALVLLMIGLLLVPSAAGQRGARVKALNLADLVSYSGVIVRGRVLSVAAEPHPDFPNLRTVVVTLSVGELLKGQAGKQYTFRQYVWDIRDYDSRLGYKVGEEVLLMLTPPTRYGLSGPVGFEQGRFHFEQDTQGNADIVNGWYNRGLMRGVEASVPKLDQNISAAARQVVQQHREGPIAYTQFKDLVRGLIAARP